MNIITYPLNDKKWINSKTNKTHIVWHGSYSRTKYTNGRMSNILARWNSLSEKYATAYVVDNDGKIFQTFPDDEWAYHLNLHNERRLYDKQSIGITFANEQQLIKRGGQYYAFDYDHASNLYLGPVCNQHWRGYEYWARLGEPQVDAAIELTISLCDKYGITPVFYAGNDWNSDVWESATIFPHSAVNKVVTDLYIEDWVISKLLSSGIKVTHS